MAERLKIASIIPDTSSVDICASYTSTAVSAYSVRPVTAVPLLKLTRFRETGRCRPSHFGRVGIGIVNSHVVDFIVTAQEEVAVAQI